MCSGAWSFQLVLVLAGTPSLTANLLCQPPPHGAADGGDRVHDIAQPRRGQCADGPVQRAVRADVGEQRPLRPEVLDVGAALPASGEHEQQVDDDLAAVVRQEPASGAEDGVGHGLPEAARTSHAGSYTGTSIA